MTKKSNDTYGLGRFGEPSILVLLSVSQEPRHGYAIAADIKEETGIELGPGTLYGAITRLCDNGLIEGLESDSRRRPYRITPKGRTALMDYMETWSRVISIGNERLVRP